MNPEIEFMKNYLLEAESGKKGFTLMELMIVIAIVAILVSVALPAYQNSVLKSNRVAGKGVLLDVASRQEQSFINNKEYADTLLKLGLPAAYYIDSENTNNVTSGAATYLITISRPTTTTFTVTAAPQNRQARDQCGTYTLTESNVRTPSTARCW